MSWGRAYVGNQALGDISLEMVAKSPEFGSCALRIGAPTLDIKAPTLRIELTVWHYRRCTRRLPYSASAYLINIDKPGYRQAIIGGSCLEAGSEGEAARDALRDLQERLGSSDLLADLQGQPNATLLVALSDPVGAISERRVVV